VERAAFAFLAPVGAVSPMRTVFLASRSPFGLPEPWTRLDAGPDPAPWPGLRHPVPHDRFTRQK